MIASSTFGKGAALVLAASGHAILAFYFMGAPKVEIEGTAGGVVARLGNSFADVASGTYQPETPDEVTPLEPNEAQPVTPNEASPVETPEIPVEQVSETTPTEPQTQTPETAQQPVTETIQTAPTTPAPTPTVSAVVPVQAVQANPTQVINATPPPEPVQAKPVQEMVKAQPEPKPKPKPVKKAAPAKPKPKPAPKPVAKKAPASAASTAQRAGQATGQETAKSTSAGQAGTKRQSGNAAASNYPGKVMRKISRVPRPRVRARGKAVVRFTVSASGALSGVSLARKSGSPELDRAALQVVRKAAPFPKPPPGAQRSFSVSIKGR